MDSTSDAVNRDVETLEPLVRRVIRARVANSDARDDLVQEALTRVLEARCRLSDEGVASYAAVTAKHLAISYGRRKRTEERKAFRLLDLSQPEIPEDETLRLEELVAVSKALEQLGALDREALTAQQADGADVRQVARRFGWTPGATAARLSRARARLRVEFLVCYQHAEPPTRRCRAVLVSLAEGDSRRQAQLSASDHLAVCSFCSMLTSPHSRAS